MSQTDDPWNKYQARLQMYSYYGAISFQVIAIFYAAAIVFATLPLAALAQHLTPMPQQVDSSRLWSFRLSIVSELSSLTLLVLGMALFCRNQELANSWVRSGLPLCNQKASYLEAGILNIENPTHTPLTGIVYVWLSFILIASYATFSLLVLSVIGP